MLQPEIFELNGSALKEEEIINFNGAALKIISFGGHPPSQIKKTRPPQLLLVGSGNPGFPELYEKFSHFLHTQTDLPVWVLGLIGFTEDKTITDDLEEKMNLDEQVVVKKEIIRRYLNGLNVICIDHSTSCYVTLHLLQSPEFSPTISHAFFLMPVMMQPDTYILQFIAFLLHSNIAKSSKSLISIQDRIPLYIRENFWKLIVSPTYAQYFSSFLQPHNYEKWIFLGKELLVVKPLKEAHLEWIKNSLDKIHVYISQGDFMTGTWCHSLKKIMPELDVRFSPTNEGHLFFLEKNEEVGRYVVNWLKETALIKE